MSKDQVMFMLVVIFLYLAGVFSVVASILNWEWFFSHRKAAVFESILGRKGARIFYFILGLGIIIFVSVKLVPMFYI